MSDLEFFDPCLANGAADRRDEMIARAGRAFRAGALTAACFIGGALCIVLAYAATLLLGSFFVDLINRVRP